MSTKKAKSTKSTKSTKSAAREVNAERVKAVLAAASAFKKANPDASNCEVIRNVAKKVKSATRSEVIKAFPRIPAATVSTQLYAGRA